MAKRKCKRITYDDKKRQRKNERARERRAAKKRGGGSGPAEGFSPVSPTAMPSTPDTPPLSLPSSSSRASSSGPNSPGFASLRKAMRAGKRKPSGRRNVLANLGHPAETLGTNKRETNEWTPKSMRPGPHHRIGIVDGPGRYASATVPGSGNVEKALRNEGGGSGRGYVDIRTTSHTAGGGGSAYSRMLSARGVVMKGRHALSYSVAGKAGKTRR